MMTNLSQEALLVRAALEAQGLETPLVANELNGQQKKEKIEGHMRAIMETLGLDLTDDSLTETPHRIAKMYVNEIFSGLDYTTFPKVTVIENKMKRWKALLTSALLLLLLQLVTLHRLLSSLLNGLTFLFRSLSRNRLVVVSTLVARLLVLSLSLDETISTK